MTFEDAAAIVMPPETIPAHEPLGADCAILESRPRKAPAELRQVGEFMVFSFGWDN